MSQYTSNVLNVREFGALGDGSRDDSQSVQTAFDYVKPGQTVYFPAGRYLITKAIKITQDNITITGHGRSSHIIYTYEQKDSDNTSTASLFVFKAGICGITVSDLKLEYTGYFFPNVGQSYNGIVNGLNFNQCFDVTIENLEISGFNASGINVGTGNPKIYAKRFKVDKCHLHHNRVAGVAFGYVEQISITNCDLEYQGSELDGGTGYGCTGSSMEIPMYIQIYGNRAMYNNRKGIDLHAGINAVIEGNICHGNRLYGIYAEGPNTGNITIRGNIVSGMNRKSLGISAPYTWIMGIDVGCYAQKPSSTDYYNYIIEGNQIYDFGLVEGDAYPINVYPDFTRGLVQVRNNTLRCGKITRLVNCSPASAKHDKSDIKIDISGNQAFIDECTDQLLDIRFYSSIRVTGNMITAGKAVKNEGLFTEQQVKSLDNETAGCKVIKDSNIYNSNLE